MPPRTQKRKNPGDDVSGQTDSPDPLIGQGHAQPLDHEEDSSLSLENEDELDHQSHDNPGNPDRPNTHDHGDDGRSQASTIQLKASKEPDSLDTLSMEELQLQFDLKTIRLAILKKKRQNLQNPQNNFVPSDLPRDSIPIDSASVLRERHNERLRRAGLFPPRQSEQVASPSPKVPEEPTRYSTVQSAGTFYGIDRKIMDIMSSTDRQRQGGHISGEKSELSKAGIKISAPEKWKGERSLQLFTEWTHSVAHYFKVHAPLSELLKVDLIGGYLAGDPLDWYWRHVAPTAHHWTAATVMVALRRQFLVDELTRQAADRFETAEQGSKDIHGFQAYLLKLADQMAEYPSPVAMNRRLLKGMKSNISSAIVANRGIDAETSSWNDIITAAMDQERAHRYAGSLTRQTPPARSDERKDSRPTRPPQGNRPTTIVNLNRPTAPININKPVSSDPRNSTGIFNRPTSTYSRPSGPAVTRPTGPKPTDQCRNCQAFGHWASECPKRNRVNLIELDDHEPDDIDPDSPNIEDNCADLIYFDNEGTEDISGSVDTLETANNNIPEVEASDEGKGDGVDLICNCISAASVMSSIRESNVSSAKPRFGDLANSPKDRPPIVLPITAMIKINGHTARALFDTGSTVDLISASFVDAHKIPSFKLKEPSPLQLAITGSRGKVNRACIATLEHGSCQNQERYFDILNLDRYDAILGTSYQKKFGVLLDISTNQIVYKKRPDEMLVPSIASFRSEDVSRAALETCGVSSSKSQDAPKINPEPPAVSVTVTREVRQDSGSLASLRNSWIEKTKDLWGPRPLKLPPFREVNHRIPLIDPAYKPYCRPAKCPEQHREAFLDKINTYTNAGWWQRASVPAAMPMMIIPKKDGKIRTVVDARQRNDNTEKDVTPFPDQDVIRRDVSRASFRSKIDMKDFFEQIRVVPEDVWKTAFATPYGVFVSLVAQQGDCNVPSTAQQLVTYLFRQYLGVFVHVYLDDTFVFSDTIEDHEKHLGIVFDVFRKAALYLSKDKLDLYSEFMVCLGHVIDNQGLHADEEKLSKIVAWKEMKTVKEVQRFLGLVQYLAQFFPNLTDMTGPISKLTHKGQPFAWGPLQTSCLERLQKAAMKAPILKPIDPVHCSDPIFVVSDASTSGIGALYGQGPTWQTMRPAGFHSRKFNPAQMNYRTHEQELLAVLEALMKWEDQLIGRKFIIITDHRSLEYLQTQRNLSARQARWLGYLSKFTYQIRYVAGETNVVADYLSRFWEDPSVLSESHDFVNADARLDDDDSESTPRLYSAAIRLNRRGKKATTAEVTTKPNGVSSKPTAINMNVLADNLGPAVQAGYSSDPFFSKIWSKPKEHSASFEVFDNYLWFKHKDATHLTACIPEVLFKGRKVTELLIDSAHKTVGHLGSVKTLAELRRHYFWPTMVKDVEAFCKSCGTCAVTKTSPKAPSGKLHSLRVPHRPWLGIALDFVGPLPESNGYDFLLVVICRFSSMVHLIPTVTTVTAAQAARLVYDNIIRFHGLPESIISDQDPRWKSTFWTELHRLLNIRLLFSTAYHPQTDGATERANRTAIQMLRGMVQSDQKDWVDKLTATEFAMNTQVHGSTGLSAFEIVYGYNPTITRNLGSVKYVSPFAGVKQHHERLTLNMMSAHDNIIASRVRQTVQANKRRSDSPEYSFGDLVYLSTSNLKLPTGRATKLLPRYIGPYKILRAFPDQDAYMLELPGELKERRIHPTFHSNLLKPYVANDDKLFPGRDPKAFYDFGSNEEEEWVVSDIVGHRWLSAKLKLLVLWSTGEKTWEPLSNCNELAALERYLELHGVDSPEKLPYTVTHSSLVKA